MADGRERESPPPAPQGGPGVPAEDSAVAQAGGGLWSDVGVGCVTAVVGLVGGGMLAVGVAKIVGALTHCVPGDEGQPCRWTDYWTWGARIGLFLLPTIALTRLWLGRRRPRNTDRG